MANRRLALAALLFGAIYDWVVVRYYQAVGAERALEAGIVSMELGLLAIGTLWAWEQSGRKPYVLLAEVAGMGIGTYLAVRFP